MARSDDVPQRRHRLTLWTTNPDPARVISVEASVGDTHEPELLVVSLDDTLEDLADAGRVVLLLRLRLERAELARHERPIEGAERPGDRAAIPEHVRLVERLPGWVVLLPVAVARSRTGGHDDPRLGTLDAGQPRVACLDELSVL